MSQDNSRRDFFRAMFGTAVAAALVSEALAQQDSPSGLPTRRLGRTSEQVSILGLGGWQIGMAARRDRQEAIRARNFKPFSDAEKKQVLARAESDAGDGRHELFKSTQSYDGPHHRRQHGFEA